MSTAPDSPRELSYRRYTGARERLRQEIKTATEQIGELGNVNSMDFASATVDLLMSGLDEYLAAAERDRESQATSRIVIVWLTVAIMVGTVVAAIATFHGAYKSPERIMIPATSVTDISICSPAPPPAAR